MLNLGPSPSEKLSTSINALIDAALQRENAKQKPRDYLGASRLGEECTRRLYFEFTAPTKAKPFPGRILRRFRLGHIHEDETADWLRLAGFDLRREKDSDGVFEFRDERAAIGGHIDGDIFGGPLPLPYPVHWEHKIMKASSWSKYVKDGVSVSHPVYHAQCVIYASNLGREHTLFTGWNSDTSETHFELVVNDAGKAAKLLERGRRIIASRSEQECPRVATVETDFRCRMCSFADHCWRKEAEPPKPAMPKFLPPWVRK